MANDLRALPDRTLNLYLYPIGAWAIAFGGLYFSSYGAYAIPLCYPLALWQAGLSFWWGRSLLARLDEGDLTIGEAHAGVRSVGQILAWSALSPAIVFLTSDPLDPAAWSTTVGAVSVSIVTYVGMMALTRVKSRWAHAASIALACLALPLNATGAVTVASMVGWFDRAMEQAPTELHPH